MGGVGGLLFLKALPLLQLLFLLTTLRLEPQETRAAPLLFSRGSRSTVGGSCLLLYAQRTSESDHFSPLRRLLPGPDPISAESGGSPADSSPSFCLPSLFPNRQPEESFNSSDILPKVTPLLEVHQVSNLTQEEARIPQVPERPDTTGGPTD